jgi:hypothetical protein
VIGSGPLAAAEAGAEIQHVLHGRQSLPRSRLEKLRLGVVMRRADVFDLP